MIDKDVLARRLHKHAKVIEENPTRIPDRAKMLSDVRTAAQVLASKKVGVRVALTHVNNPQKTGTISDVDLYKAEVSWADGSKSWVPYDGLLVVFDD